MRCHSPTSEYNATSNHWPARSSKPLRGISKKSWVGTVSLPSHLQRDICGSSSSRSLCRERRKKPYHKPLIFRRHANRGSLRSGQILNDRYEIIDCVGEGTTATVLEAWDMDARSRVVIKIQKAADRVYVMREIEVLQAISEKHADVAVIRLLDWFDSPDNQNICLVFEKGVTSLWDYMLKHPRFCLHDIQMYGRQLLRALAAIHSCGVTHADLKPENVVFTPADLCPEPMEVSPVHDSQGNVHSTPMPCSARLHHEFDDKDMKIIDFGLAVFEHTPHPPVVGTRAYSPPEIVLGHSWSTPLDVWGLACVLMELYTGRTLFKSKDDIEQLALFESTLGPVPSSLIQRTTPEKRESMFTPMGFVNWREYSHDPRVARSIDNQQPLLHYFHPDDILFYDVISRMLSYDAEERLTAEEALLHPFFTQGCECSCDRDGLHN